MNDIQLHCIDQGQGQPSILLHGNGENGEYFGHQIAYFCKKYRVIALDTRGHGQSPRGNKPFTIKQFADDLLNFMDEKDIQKVLPKLDSTKSTNQLIVDALGIMTR